MMKSAVVFVVAVLFAGPCSAQSFIGPSGKPAQQVKCIGSPTACYQQANATCQGSYQILDSESHRGGLLADLGRNGPMMWYSMTYICGPSDGRLGTFEFRGPPKAMTTCSQIGNTVTCTYN